MNDGVIDDSEQWAKTMLIVWNHSRVAFKEPWVFKELQYHMKYSVYFFELGLVVILFLQ